MRVLPNSMSMLIYAYTKKYDSDNIQQEYYNNCVILRYERHDNTIVSDNLSRFILY